MTPIKKNVFGMGDITGYEVLDHLVDKNKERHLKN